MAKVFATVKAIITRIIFSAHGFLAIWQVAQSKRDPVWWSLCTPIGLLVFEGIFTLTIKKNQEWRWFCPSVFLYLSSVVPAIWLLELDKMERRLRMMTGDDAALRPPNFKDLDKILGNQFKLPEIRVDSGTWITLIEQFLMLILIIGRWMLPKGDLTRDQLSQLLLVYIGTAADIIEFFDSFKDNTIANERLLVFLTLGIWSWSLLQFTIVLSATRARKPRGSSSSDVQYSASGNCCCSIDAWGIMLNILLQDLPFLAFRLLIIIHYKIISYMNVFFTCKNTLVILLQLYRLVVVHAESRKAYQAKMRSRDMEGIYTISGNRKREPGQRRRINEEDSGRSSAKHSKKRNTSSSKRDVVYLPPPPPESSSTSSSSSSSESSSSAVVEIKKSHRKLEAQKVQKPQKDDSTKRKSSKKVQESNGGHHRKRPAKYVEEEGTASESKSESESEVAVVEVIKEKRNKRKKQHRKQASSSD